ncbi:MAG: pilus assembly protein TadG-related protein [Alphaproteobacteria bacterium]
MTMFGIATPVLIGFVALAVETGTWYQSKRELQTAADAAAISGAFQRARNDVSGINGAATKEAVRNGFVNATPNVLTIHYPPTTGINSGEADAVEVILARPQNLLLSSLFKSSPFTVSVRAVAAVQTTGTACILALDPTASAAVKNQGNTDVVALGCTIAANSNSATAITITGSGQMAADSLWTVGGYSVGGSGTLTLTHPPFTNAWALDDPYEHLTIPSLGPCTQTNYSANNAQTISPGVYCGGMDFGSQADVILEPGTYYIDGGNFTANAQSRLRCSCPNAGDGVTFVLTSTATPPAIGTVTINGGADIDLTAPTLSSYDYPMVMFYQDPRAEPGPVNKLNGGSSMFLTGAVYFPKQAVEFTGDNTLNATECTQIVAKTITFIGNSKINDSGCQNFGLQPIRIKGVRIVE